MTYSATPISPAPSVGSTVGARRRAAKRSHGAALERRGYTLADLAGEPWQHAIEDYFQPRIEQGRLY